MIDAIADVSIAARSLVRRPGLAVGAVLTIALGIGATTTIYSVVDAVVLRPLPYVDPGSLVAVGLIAPGTVAVEGDAGRQELLGLTSIEIDAFRDRSRALQALAGVQRLRIRVLAEDREEQSLEAVRISADMFSILGVSPALGRFFLADEFQRGGSQAVILTHDFWQSRYGRDPNVLGRAFDWQLTAWASSRPTIVGVLPRDFHPPEAFFREGDIPDVYLPMEVSANGLYTGLSAVGRLAPGTTLEQARVEASAISVELMAEVPMPPTLNDGRERIIGVNDLYVETVGTTGGTLWVFLGAAGLLLSLTVMNAATLLLARGLDRHQELDVRVALGAGQLRVAWLLLSEAGALSVVGGLLGIVLAYGGVAAFLRFAPPAIPRLGTVALDGRVLIVAVMATVLAAIGSGLLPAFALTRRSVWDGLQAGSRSVSEPASPLRTALVGGQLALAMVLFCGAGLLFNSFLKLRAADSGFEPDGLVVTSPTLTRPLQVRSLAEYQALWDPVLVAFTAVPGVTSAAGASGLPFEAPNWTPRILLPEDPPETVREGIAGYAITPGFLETMGIEVVRGRGFGPEDGSTSEPVAIVNEAFVRTQLGGRDVLGMIVTRDIVRLSNFGPPEQTTLRVVGVVEDVVQARAEDGPRPAVYIPHAQADAPQLAPWWSVVRSDLPPAALATPELRRSLDGWDVRPESLTPMGERMALTQITPRFRTLLLGAFAGVALVLAALGLHASLAHMVRRRQRELGVRMALGADRASIVRMVMGQGMRLSAVCLLIGLLATLAMSRVLASFLFGMEPYDPRTLTSVMLVLLLVCAAACVAPARKATSVDPMRVLQSE